MKHEEVIEYLKSMIFANESVNYKFKQTRMLKEAIEQLQSLKEENEKLKAQNHGYSCQIASIDSLLEQAEEENKRLKSVDDMENKIFDKLFINPYWIDLQHEERKCRGISEYLSEAIHNLIPKLKEGE